MTPPQLQVGGDFQGTFAEPAGLEVLEMNDYGRISQEIMVGRYGVWAALAILVLLVTGCIIIDPPETSESINIAITLGNGNGAAFVHNGTRVEVHLTVKNESIVKADQLDIECRLQFGTNQNGQTIYYTDTFHRVLATGNVADYDLYLSESEMPVRVRFADLSLVAVSEVAVYNFKQDATRPIRRQIIYGKTVYSNR